MAELSDSSDVDWLEEIEQIQAIDDYFDKNQNELLRNWLKLSHLIDEIDDNVFSLCFKSIVDLFGGFKILLNELISQSSNNKQLDSLFKLLKHTNNEYQNNIQHINNKNVKTKCTKICTISYLDELPSELLSYLCGYLNRNDITIFKMISRNIGVVCLEEMSKISIGIINANKLLSELSMIEFTEIKHNNRQQLMEIKAEINSLKSKKIDLDCDILTASLEEQENIKKQKLKIISLIKQAKTKEKTFFELKKLQFNISYPSYMQNDRLTLNTTFYDVFDQFNNKYNIPIQYQLIYRFNYPFQLFDIQNTNNMTNEIQLSHINNRQFIVFDKRKIFHLNASQNAIRLDKKTNEIKQTNEIKFILLKYYDIETEKLHFVGFLMIDIDVTIITIINYLETQFIYNLYQKNQSNSTLKNKWYYRLYFHLQNMNMIDDNTSKRLRIYKEGSKMFDNKTKIKYFMNTSQNIDGIIHNGDILIFQLNFIHIWFKTQIAKQNGIFEKIISKKKILNIKWYYKVDEYLSDQNSYSFCIRQQNYFSKYYFKNKNNINMNNIKYYLQKHIGITQLNEQNKILTKIKNCCQCLRIFVCASYSYGYFRKCIANEMNNIIGANNIHLYNIKDQNFAKHLEWNSQWRNKKIVCQWSIVSFNTQEAMIINGIQYRIYVIKIYKPNQIPMPIYVKDVKFIVIKFENNFIVGDMVKHIIFCMKESLVEYKYKDIIESINCGNDNIFNRFNFVLCVGDNCLNGFGMNEEINHNYDIDYILPMHLFIIPKINMNLKSNESVLYVRFMFERIEYHKNYVDYCCGFPVKIVIKRNESLQSIIDSGKLLKYGVLKVLSCYRIKYMENTQTQIKKKRLNVSSAVKSWDYYKPFEKQNLKDQIAMTVVMKYVANADKSEQRPVVGKCVLV